VIWLGGVLLTAFGFVLGKVYSQSESVLAEKRRVFEAALRELPVPNDVCTDRGQEADTIISRQMGPLIFYSSIGVIKAFQEYI